MRSASVSLYGTFSACIIHTIYRGSLKLSFAEVWRHFEDSKLTQTKNIKVEHRHFATRQHVDLPSLNLYTTVILPGVLEKVLSCEEVSNNNLLLYCWNSCKILISILQLRLWLMNVLNPTKLVEMYELENETSFSREVDFGYFWVLSFYRSQMQCMFISMNVSWSSDETIRLMSSKQKQRSQKSFHRWVHAK